MKEGNSIDIQSEIISKTTGMMYPFILLFGCYVILNGSNNPGGGFQGGAILCAVFISRYFALPIHDIKLDRLKLMEKILFLLIVLTPMTYLFFRLNDKYPSFNSYYLVIINILIGLKVCFGLTIIFFRFIFYESR